MARSGPVSDDALIQAALSVWPFHDRQPLAIGVAAGVVWATARGRAYGINGYALIPAEGHPWSRDFPNDINQEKESAESRERSHDFMERVRQGRSLNDAVIDVYSGLPDRDYLDNYLNAHGGISWYVHPWVGFDTGHAGDIWEREWDKRDFCANEREYRQSWSINWTPEKVVEEAKKLARQVAEVGRE
jgi:hypothetical protein